MPEAVLAVDLGGTQMRAALVGPTGTVEVRRSRPTPQDEECPDALVTLAGDLLDREIADRAVIGVPGRVDYREGRLEHAPNLPPRWPGALHADALSDRLGVPVSIANDADAAAVGEACFGVGRGHEDVVYVTFSTGVGAGVVLGGRLVAGRRSGAELGHTVLDLSSLRAGGPATVEELASGTALERLASDRGLPPDGAELVEQVRAGDDAASSVWEIVVEAVATAVVNLAHLYSPSVIVLGGGLGRNGDLLLGPVRRQLAELGPSQPTEPVAIEVAALGDDAGLVGAAGWTAATRKDDA